MLERVNDLPRILRVACVSETWPQDKQFEQRIVGSSQLNALLTSFAPVIWNDNSIIPIAEIICINY